MQPWELLVEEAIVLDLKSTTKDAAIEELLLALCSAGQVRRRDVKALLEALMARELKGSTGVGKGVALPHAKHESVKEVLGTFGRSAAGVEFKSLDGKPVHSVFLLLSSTESSGPHVEALGGIARLMRSNMFCKFVHQVKSYQELVELLQEGDEL